MLNLHHLELLRTVAASGSVSRAAERLGISQPAVSMQLKKLEEAVGIALVVSRGRNTGLTEAGEALVGYAHRILRLNEEALGAIADFKAQRRGRVRLAASSTPGAYLLPPAIAAFREQFPGVTVSLDVNNTRRALALVAEGMADLAVVGDVAPDDPDAVLEPLFDDCLTVVVAPGHPWAERGAITAQELAREPLLLREEGSNTRAVLDERLLEAAGRRPRPAMELGSTEAVKEAVAAGLGPSVLSGLAVRWEIASGRFRPVAVTGVNLCRRLHLAQPVGGELTPMAGQFAAHLRRWGEGR